MTGTVITIAQQKGGAGKTTLTVQLGVLWSAQGQRVAMVDIDPQGSLISWSGLRQESGAGNGAGPMVEELSGWRVGAEVRRLRNSYDLILIDSPPHAETEARTAIREGDLTLIPCQPHALDIWATAATLEIARREGRPVLLVLNRVPPRGRSADEIRAEIGRKGWPLARAALGNRQAFASSLGAGRGVAETAPKSVAAGEIGALCNEVLATLGHKPSAA